MRHLIIKDREVSNLKNKKVIFISVVTIMTITLLYISDQIFNMNYIAKVGIKLVLFSIFPAIYIIKTGDNVLKDSIKNRDKKIRIKLSTVLGIVIFLAIISTYLILKNYIDIGTLVNEFENKYKINKSNIIYYGVYLAFINSLLEEFFFRGFIFLNLKKLELKKTAYILSSMAFFLYHIANFKNWFSIGLFIFVSVGLFVGGCIFNYLDDKQNTFFNSWFVHICADLAIILIGFKIFNVF